ncbi:MAG: dCTP deaminase [Actinobacteria bacterium]|nr:dCTP deaminase [Actinomycetota bacterium]
MILSDRSIREELDSGRIVIDPLGDDAVQPSSVDLRVDASFRVFANHRYPYIDVREPQPDLTELIKVPDDEPFMLHPGEFVLGSTYERVALPDDLVARLEGKALALDTEVPTPSGWTTMGGLRAGDVVFDERGVPTPVVAVTPPMLDRPCRRVVLSDGTTIVADLEHRWVTVDKNGRRRGRRVGRTRTTEEIARTLSVRGERNHQIMLAEPVQYPEQTLPIDPYVFGVWLGDGTSTKPEITTADQFVVDGNGSLHSALRRVGVLGDKHIPDAYLHASVPQREALLQGLMDSDGYIDRIGRCDFTSVRERLAEQVQQLVASLGLRPTFAKKRAVLDGIDRGPKYEVQFTPDRPVFRLPRKLARQKCEGGLHRFRAISDVQPMPSVPVRCIQVGSPSGQFLVARSYVATHNSSLGRLGLLIHSTAGFVDAGWDGWLTLELSNVATLPIAIYPQMKIGQLAFFQLSTPADRPYGSAELGSKYRGQQGPTASRYFENFAETGSANDVVDRLRRPETAETPEA